VSLRIERRCPTRKQGKIRPTERETHVFDERQRRMTCKPRNRRYGRLCNNARSRERCITNKRRYIPSRYHLADFLPLRFAMEAKSSKKSKALLRCPTASIDLRGPVFFVCYDLRRAPKSNQKTRWIIFRRRLHMGDRNDLCSFLASSERSQHRAVACPGQSNECPIFALQKNEVKRKYSYIVLVRIGRERSSTYSGREL
jgi:hypothetical protein